MTIAVKRRHLTIRRWLPSAPEGAGAILNVGCGTVPLPGATEAWRTVSLEVERRPFPNPALYDGSVFPFRDNSFEAALCLDVLEHVEDDGFMLAEIARVSRPGARQHGQQALTLVSHWQNHLPLCNPLGRMMIGLYYARC